MITLRPGGWHGSHHGDWWAGASPHLAGAINGRWWQTASCLRPQPPSGGDCNRLGRWVMGCRRPARHRGWIRRPTRLSDRAALAGLHESHRWRVHVGRVRAQIPPSAQSAASVGENAAMYADGKDPSVYRVGAVGLFNMDKTLPLISSSSASRSGLAPSFPFGVVAASQMWQPAPGATRQARLFLCPGVRRVHGVIRMRGRPAG
jgi:hypothetical protein